MDPARAQGLLAALELARADAERGAALDFDLLGGWQVCFFHPFDDGNARSAFLALVFVLAREGVALDGVGPIRRITCRADDPQDAVSLARSIGFHTEDTRRTAASRAS
ncbi:Fic family protein [Streptomyces flavotricini]|uniref:Fic family protein n=1 Tax=Streptomyces flavotricini TaxID=66888 RepID=A0ABS8EFX0_9ACTN|nr:Fic family protein [Streptomyces flavotricini]